MPDERTTSSRSEAHPCKVVRAVDDVTDLNGVEADLRLILKEQYHGQIPDRNAAHG
jgi:hypothetical protein